MKGLTEIERQAHENLLSGLVEVLGSEYELLAAFGGHNPPFLVVTLPSSEVARFLRSFYRISPEGFWLSVYAICSEDIQLKIECATSCNDLEVSNCRNRPLWEEDA